MLNTALTSVNYDSGVSDEFAITSHRMHVPKHELMDLLHGRRLAICVHDFLSEDQAGALADAVTAQASTCRDDGVPALGIGPTSFRKTLDAYLDEVQNTRSALEAVYASAACHVPGLLSEWLQLALPARTVRLAQHRGREAAALRAMCWSGNDDGFALKPHDDLQQYMGQTGELAGLLLPIAVNIYLRKPQEAGNLVVWAVRPALATKARLGVHEDGYPYPLEHLVASPCHTIAPAAGTMVLLDGRSPHAVPSFPGQPTDRILLNGFIGLLRDGVTLLMFT
jgi:hypothetical protein